MYVAACRLLLVIIINFIVNDWLLIMCADDTLTIHDQISTIEHKCNLDITKFKHLDFFLLWHKPKLNIKKVIGRISVEIFYLCDHGPS